MYKLLIFLYMHYWYLADKIITNIWKLIFKLIIFCWYINWQNYSLRLGSDRLAIKLLELCKICIWHPISHFSDDTDPSSGLDLSLDATENKRLSHKKRKLGKFTKVFTFIWVDVSFFWTLECSYVLQLII